MHENWGTLIFGPMNKKNDFPLTCMVYSQYWKTSSNVILSIIYALLCSYLYLGDTLKYFNFLC